jgi:DNA-binding MarR family transcriptional regulator
MSRQSKRKRPARKQAGKPAAKPAAKPADRPAAWPAEPVPEQRAATDSIEHLLAEWTRERPDLDPSPFGIYGRIWRLSTTLIGDAEQWLKPLGLTFESFSLIVTLRRSGPPYELNPTALYRESLLSSGAITNRIDRVESAGLVVRLPDPNDRRGTIVRLTAKGRNLADRSIKLHFEALAATLGDLSGAECEQLAALLSKLLLSAEHRRVQKPARRKRS